MRRDDPKRPRRPAAAVLRTGVAVLLLALALPSAAVAQTVQRIAAVVNDEVVSSYDVQQRIAIVVASTNIPDSQEARTRLQRQMLDTLIDERLQLQEAERLNINVEDQEVEQSVDRLAQQNNMSRELFERQVTAAGIDIDTLRRQMRAELAWGKVVARRLRPTVTIGDEEIAEELERREAAVGRPQTRVGEVFLPVDSPEAEETVLRSAERLVQQLRDGANFQAIARQFSRSASAANGGDIGFVRDGQLSGDLDAAVQALAPGGISPPVRGTGGYYIMAVLERRTPGAANPLQTRLSLLQVTFPNASLGDGSERADAARRLAAGIEGCERAAEVKQRTPDAFVDELGAVRLGEMPAQLRDTVVDLPIGQFSPPILNDGGAALLMVCARDEPTVARPTAESVGNDLLRERLGVLAYRYLRDLRRAAVIEYR